MAEVSDSVRDSSQDLRLHCRKEAPCSFYFGRIRHPSLRLVKPIKPRSCDGSGIERGKHTRRCQPLGGTGNGGHLYFLRGVFFSPNRAGLRRNRFLKTLNPFTKFFYFFFLLPSFLFVFLFIFFFLL